MLRKHSKQIIHSRLLLLLALTLSLPLLAIAPLTVGAAAQPQVTLTPNSGWSDSLLEFQGTNFSPYTQVKISIASLSYWGVTTTTNAQGAFDSWFNVPDGLSAGTYAVKAEDSNGNSAYVNFTLNSVYVSPSAWGGSFGIRTQKQIVQWFYDNSSLYCDTWKFYHNSQDDWYSVMSGGLGLYVLRLSYNGTTYVFDLANGKYNAVPQPLVERVMEFAVKAPNQIQGTILIYTPNGSTLLATITMDIYAPISPQNYYAVNFKITPETNLNDVALYAVYDLNVNQPLNNWATYDGGLDAVYQFYGPSAGSTIPEQQKGYAGYGSVLPASTHHDVEIDYVKMLCLTNYLRDYNYDLRDRNQVYGDSYVNCGVGMQWVIGTANARTNYSIPIAYAASDESQENFETNEANAKMLAYQAQPSSPIINLTTNEAPGSSIASVNGAGFMPYSNVDLRFGGVSVGSFTADAKGSFNGQFIVPTSLKGNYSVTATDSYGLKATVNFAVTELTLQWLMDKLDSMNATITQVVTDSTGKLNALISTNSGNILASLSDINATLVGIIGNATGDVLARIDTKVGETLVKVDQINATLVGLIGDAKGDLLARIDSRVGEIQVKVGQINATLVGIIGNATGDVLARIDSRVGETLVKVDAIQAKLIGIVGDAEGDILARIDSQVGQTLVKVDQINATLVGIIGNATGDVLARIDSRVGEIQVKVDQINATLVGLIGDAKGDLLARIDSKVGEILVKVDQINATFVGIIGDAKGDLLARIDSKVGETLVKVDQINATLVGIIGNAKGDVLARIDSKVGETLVKVDQINATLVEIIGNAKGDVLARIDSRVGETLVKVDQINATLTGIIGNAKGDVLARIDTRVGDALVKLDTINGQLSSVSGSMATIQSSLGNIQVSLSDLNTKVTKIEGDVATITTSLGNLTGKVIKMEGDIATIQTDIGTLKADTKLVRSDFSLQPIAIAAVIEVAAISGIVYTIWAYRKREIAKKELVIAEASSN